MEEKNNDMISFANIVKLLLSKKRLIICIALIVALLAGALGAIFSPGNTYGADIDFYVSGGTLDERMLSLLRSKLFTEKLLLDENGLTGDKNSETYKAALSAKEAYGKVLDEQKELKIQLEAMPVVVSGAEKLYEEKREAYEDTYNIFNTYMSVYLPENANSTKRDEYAAAVNEALAEKNKAEAAYSQVLSAYQSVLLRQQSISLELQSLKDEMDVSTEVVLAPWRQLKETRMDMETLMESISYEYPGGDTNKSFISVSVAIEKDMALANAAVDRIIDILPEFVAENVTTAKESTEEPACTLADTMYEVELINPFGRVIEGVKYGLLSGIAVAVLVALAIVGVALIKLTLSADGEAAESNENKDEISE